MQDFTKENTKRILPLLEEDEEKALPILSKISENILAVMTAIFTGMANSKREDDTEAIKLQRCIIQYMADKHFAVHNLTTSQLIVSINGNDKIVHDYTYATSIVRSMYETLLIYHSIYITPKTQEEQTFLINILKYKGLLFPAKKITHNLPIVQTANQEREKLLQEIKLCPLYHKNYFEDIKNKSLFYFDGSDNNRHLVCCSFGEGWKMLRNAGLFQKEVVKSLYSRLSTETHMTYFGLMMYEQQNEIRPSPRLLSLYLSCAFFSYMLIEITLQDERYKEIFNKLNVQQQEIIRAFIDVL